MALESPNEIIQITESPPEAPHSLIDIVRPQREFSHDLLATPKGPMVANGSFGNASVTSLLGLTWLPFTGREIGTGSRAEARNIPCEMALNERGQELLIRQQMPDIDTLDPSAGPMPVPLRYAGRALRSIPLQEITLTTTAGVRRRSSRHLSQLKESCSRVDARCFVVRAARPHNEDKLLSPMIAASLSSVSDLQQLRNAAENPDRRGASFEFVASAQPEDADDMSLQISELLSHGSIMELSHCHDDDMSDFSSDSDVTPEFVVKSPFVAFEGEAQA